MNGDLDDYITTIETVATTTFTIAANSSLMLTSDYLEIPAIPDGYKRLAFFIRVDGDPAVVSVGYDDAWIHNTKDTTSDALTARYLGIYARNI